MNRNILALIWRLSRLRLLDPGVGRWGDSDPAQGRDV